jgi:hypothetical protein
VADDQHVPGTCRSDQQCRDHDGRTACPTSRPLCDACLEAAGPGIRGLVFDYLDLAQLHEATMSQAVTEKTAGSKEKQMLLVGHVEALQAEIVHVATTWEYEVRIVARLSDPYVSAPIADWHTTISKPTPLAKVRPGACVQRAVNILSPRLSLLSNLPPTLVCPTGIEDAHVPVAGWEAIHHLQDLHRRCRSILGRTRRLLSLHGTCPKRSCGAQALYRLEPESFKDEPPVWCDACKASRTYAEYEWFMAHLKWPPHEDDELEDAGAQQVAA